MSSNTIFEHHRFMFTISYSIIKRVVQHFVCKMVMLLSFFFISNYLSAQIKWRNDSIPFNEIAWNNMSTSYIDNPDKLIALVTAIPYNGIDGVGDNKELDLYFTSSYYRYQSNLSNHFQKLDTYDSSNVYFLTPGIFKSNADSFEYRILKDGDSVIKDWSKITQFADSNFQLNAFRKYCGFLGGYHTTWNHFITVQLRRKNNSKNLAESSVYWKQIHPRVASIYTSDDLNEFLMRLKGGYMPPADTSKQKKWKEEYASADDSIHHRPKTFVFEPGENNIIFYLNASIYWRGALEYSLMKDGKTIADWKPNDFDNNFVWLQKLGHGHYELKIRFAKQRHNVSTYLFEITPFWYETALFHYSMLAAVGAITGFIIVFFLNRRKLQKERSKTEQLQLEQRTVRSQLNPHFIFNALSSIQSLMNQNKITEANYYFTEFSTLLRDAMRNSKKEMLPLIIELQTLENYIRLEQLRFHFNYTIAIAETINTSNIEVPSLLLQPLIENAIKHGISSLQEEGKICIELKTKDKDLIIFIKDNGKGFSPDATKDGYGLSLTKERIKLINQSLTQQKIAFNISSNVTGTTVLLNFENWL